MSLLWTGVCTLHLLLPVGSGPGGIKNALKRKEKPCEIQKHRKNKYVLFRCGEFSCRRKLFFTLLSVQYCRVGLSGLLEITETVRLQVEAFWQVMCTCFSVSTCKSREQFLFYLLIFLCQVGSGGRCRVCMFPACSYLHVCLKGLGLL